MPIMWHNKGFGCFSDGVGKELVTRYHVYGMNTNSTFYTDSNGREMLERKLNQRPSYYVNLQEPVAGNYYPVTTRISIKDENMRMSVLTDRAEGGTSLEDGEIELMVRVALSLSIHSYVWRLLLIEIDRVVAIPNFLDFKFQFLGLNYNYNKN